MSQHLKKDYIKSSTSIALTRSNCSRKICCHSPMKYRFTSFSLRCDQQFNNARFMMKNKLKMKKLQKVHFLCVNYCNLRVKKPIKFL